MKSYIFFCNSQWYRCGVNKGQKGEKRKNIVVVSRSENESRVYSTKGMDF